MPETASVLKPEEAYVTEGGQVIALVPEGEQEIAGIAKWTLSLPAVERGLAPILYSVPVQLLAYYTAVAKGTDVDQPRNLAKSVTVE